MCTMFFLFGHVLVEVCHDAGRLGADGAALGVDGAVLMAVDQALAVGPAQGGFRPAADGASVRELGQIASSRQIVALEAGVLVQHHGELLAGHVAVGVVQVAANARHNVVLGGPSDGVHSPVARGHVGKGGVAGHNGLAFQVVEQLSSHSPVQLHVGLEGVSSVPAMMPFSYT